MKILVPCLMLLFAANALSAQAPPLDRYYGAGGQYRDGVGQAFQLYSRAGAVGGAAIAALKGHPFSATEETRTVQTLANGTHIETSASRKLFRDMEGRTRVENSDGTVTLVDPVLNVKFNLEPKSKSSSQANGFYVGGYGDVLGELFRKNFPTLSTGKSLVLPALPAEAKEDLGLRGVNGVTARGERVTVTIPKGQIGNDKEIKVVTERWTSDDLQMLVRSVNSDPRYGETTYELKDISLGAPSPSLFQPPVEYTVKSSPLAPTPDLSGGGRGERGSRQ